ncbi:type I polyketide synthase, partial [Nocardia ninae]
AASLDQLALSTSTAAPALYSLDWEPVTDQRAPETGEDPAWTEIDSTADSKAAVGSETHPVLILRETSPESGDWPTHVRAETIRVTEAVQQWLTHESSKRLVVVTCRATAVGPRDDVVDLAHAPVWGLLRSAQNENPNRLVLIDIDDWTQVGDAVSAATRSAAPQIALRRGQILAPRLIAGGPTPITGSDRVLESSWRLQIGDRQTLDGENFLAVAAEAEASLAPGEVRIAVRATGVNFRDVVTTLGMVSDQGALIGSEGAGVVIGVADDVRSFVVGDHVMGVIPAVGSVAVTDHRLLVPVPDGWSFAEAAGVPVAFLTAYYALVHLADLQQGQKLLVHAAAGGVGMAAVQIAQHLGAEVFATASAGKWSAVRVLGLTDERIADSRSLEFESKFSSQSDERAMDVVLGSLAGEQVDASLRLVTPGGAYIEMGKTDIRDPRQAPDGVSYAAFTLGAVEPALIQRMLAAIMAAFAAGSFRLIPTTATDVRLTPTVFRDMSQAKHIGKNVLTIPSPLNKEGTVLIVGGTGQIGRQVARHFATRHGVRHILLLSRTGAEAGDTDPIVTELAELGTAVDIRRCDAADKQQLAEVISTIPDHRPLTAVVHSAGALDDSVFAALQPQHFDRVFESKVDVAWNLHELTKDIDLSIFVMFSSIAGQFGSPGQANYAAANSFVDSLIQHRNNRGLPGTSIVWGLWAPGTGMTGHLTESDRARLRRAGVLPISADEGMRLFDEAISTAQPAPIAARIDMSPASAAGQPSSSSKHGSARNTGVSSNADLTEKLATLDAAGQRAFILSIVKAQVAATLGHSTVADVRVANTFRDLGFDSLSAVDFRNRLQNTTGIKLPATVVFDYPTPGDLAGYINEELTRKPAQPAPAANSKPASEGVASDPVVIVGMGCRFPGGVSSPAGLWDVVVGERDVISGFPVDRGWDVEGVFDPVPGTPGRSYVREGGFLDGAAEFDAGFFGISPREALAMDPQQRLLLEVSWEAVESAGIDPRRLKGSNTGVYTGVLGTSNYSVDSAASTPGLDGYRLTGNTSSVASGRVSYVLGLEGPAVSVDTACSSSLVALHLAVQGLRLGECDMALVSGVTVMPTPSAFVEFSQLRGLAADGRCKAFAEGADGFVPSEGVGVLVVERLSDAVRLGHRVLAVVRGSAVNQDGASNGLSAPNGPAQQRVIRAALANARVSPADLDAVEAHGTGTQLGDPIEAQALMATYGARAEGAQPLWLGSIKSNIGHTSAAAGVAGVIKMVMALRHEMLPATLHVDRPSAQIDWSSGQVELLTSSRAWPRDPNHVRRAGVSSFGISGTNAHVIVEEAPTMKPVEVNPVPMWPATIPWTLSGRTGDALEQQASRLWARVDGDTDVDILDVGLSLTNRTLFGYRAVVLGADRAELLSGLRALADGSAPSIDGAVLHGRAGVEGKTVFVFPGQGSQWAQMGVELFDTSTVFAVHLIECERVLTEFVDWRLTDVLRGVPGAPTLERVDVVQPALFAVMVSLARLWQSMGVHPDAVIGHSQGEVAAAHIAGALTLRDAAHLIAYRSKAIRRIAGEGTMATVAVPTADILQKTRDWTDRIEIAATNSPVSTVVSGSVAAVTRLVEEYEEAGVRARRIPVDFASHSRSVEDLRNELIALTEIRGVGSNIDFYSSTVGGLIDTDALDEQYWYQNLRETVQFDRAVDAAYADGARFFIEISPHPVLTVSLEEIFDARADPEPNFIGQTLRREEGGMQRFLASAASLFCAGGQTDWRSVFAGTNAEP